MGVTRTSLVDSRIVFTPLPGFPGAATSVSYRVSDVNGTPATSTYTPVVPVDATPIDVGTIYAANTGVVGQPVTVDLRSVIPARRGWRGVGQRGGAAR